MAESNSYVGEIRQFKLNATEWSVYKSHLFNYFVANEISNSVRRRAVFLNMLDEEAYKLITSLCYPALPENTPFTSLLLLFDSQFASQVSVFVERYKFYNAMRHKGESAKDWAERVKNLAARCHFGSALEVCMRDKFVYGFQEDFFNVLENDVNISFEDAVKLAQENEDLNHHYDYYNMSPCCHCFHMLGYQHFYPTGCYVKDPHLSSLHGLDRCRYLINYDLF